jgi:type I restriction enzyme R subunit
MPKPGEHKTVQSCILKYAQEIGRTLVPRDEAERRRGFDSDVPPTDRTKGTSLSYDPDAPPKLENIFHSGPPERVVEFYLMGI